MIHFPTGGRWKHFGLTGPLSSISARVFIHRRSVALERCIGGPSIGLFAVVRFCRVHYQASAQTPFSFVPCITERIGRVLSRVHLAQLSEYQ